MYGEAGGRVINLPENQKMFIVKHWHNSSVVSSGYHSMVQAMSESIGEDSDRKHPACDLSYFGRREFSFILGNDVYLRYQSFNNAAQMESSTKRECPFKIDISAVHNVDPAKRNAYSGENAFTPVEELVFNIDMSDYDDVRYCCSGANICKKCWPLMTIAIKVIDSALRGFVYAMYPPCRLNNAQRAAIADCFHVYKGSQSGCEKVFLEGPLVLITHLLVFFQVFINRISVSYSSTLVSTGGEKFLKWQVEGHHSLLQPPLSVKDFITVPLLRILDQSVGSSKAELVHGF
ncbi:DNA primase small subunit-like [Papaver somniferum]|uniref:DNA primase small subunit-like n=1 Tax=Papaver somniferum TaxID=3469 RepID=UPI000E702EA0|nr:DNA primase small subunit-like [Papaver somniferum]